MGKPFERELLEIDSTLEWVDLCDVKELRDFLCHNPQIPLFIIKILSKYHQRLPPATWAPYQQAQTYFFP